MAPNKQRRHLARLAAQQRKAPEQRTQSDVLYHGDPDDNQSSPSDTEIVANLDGPDSWIFDIQINELDAISSRPWLEWKKGAGSQLRKAHNGYGGSSLYAKQAEHRRRVASGTNCRPISSYFDSSAVENVAAPEISSPVLLEIVDDEEKESGDNNDFSASAINTAISKLNEIVQLRNNAQIEKRSKASKFDFIHHLSVLRF